MKNAKNKRTIVLGSILLGLFIVAYRIMFVVPIEEVEYDENIAAIERVEDMLSQIEVINFDDSVLKNPLFHSLKSIEKPFLSLPVGKTNPFSVSGN